MSRGLSTFLIIAFTIGGILLGNAYGRRDAANSRPPTIYGQTGEQGNVAVDLGYKLETLALRNASGGLYGSVSVLNLNDGRTDALFYVSPLEDGEFRVVLFGKDNKPKSELTTFGASARVQIIRAQFKGLESGDYFAVLSGGGERILTSDKVQ